MIHNKHFFLIFYPILLLLPLSGCNLGHKNLAFKLAQFTTPQIHSLSTLEPLTEFTTAAIVLEKTPITHRIMNQPNRWLDDFMTHDSHLLQENQTLLHQVKLGQSTVDQTWRSQQRQITLHSSIAASNTTSSWQSQS